MTIASQEVQPGSRRKTIPSAWKMGKRASRLWMAGILYFSFAMAIVSGSPTQSFMLNLILDGPIEDAQCNVEDLEEANDSQLYSILQELALRTEFFVNFVVDLDASCPLSTSSHTIDDGGHGLEQEDEEDFECGGSPEQDDDDEPLCTVDAGASNDMGFGFMGTATATSSMTSPPTSSSNALYSLSQEGFESPDQQQAFSWKEQTDMVVEPTDDEASCADADLPDSFWIDMCSNIKEEQTKVVDLALNPERNTGYNGTHLWNAIYQEHCGYIGQQDDDYNMQCLENRVLYRLLSGLHTSTTLSIAKHYYPPSKRKNRTDWEANPDYFMEKLGSSPRGGEYIRNLHFSYVVLLRALKKATPLLKNYEIRTGDIVKDEAATVLLRRLLDSHILHSCFSVFEAFDESQMFRQNATNMKQHFKGVFHNISSILDCVQCQQCKLHGKMAMMGYGTALKILFMKQFQPLERNEIVALIQTLAKLSRSLREVRELTQLFYSTSQTIIMPPDLSTTSWDSWNIVDQTVGLISQLRQPPHSVIGSQQETSLIQLALQQHPPLLILAKHYGHDINQFWNHLEQSNMYDKNESAVTPEERGSEYDAVVIGSGLAGLAASWHILNRGGRVLLLEKEHLLGGNSNKASSGINAYVLDSNVTAASMVTADTMDLFVQDTIKSAGPAARPDLIQQLVSHSEEAVRFLREDIGVDLSLKAQLGGHSSKRTHRPSNGMAGAEIIYGLQKAVRKFEKTGQVTISVDTRVTEILTETESGTGSQKVVGVEYQKSDNGEAERIFAPHIILATGGFASDRRDSSYLSQYRPDLLSFPTTAGSFSTGDGITMATALGAGTTLMDKVQVHPTGWVDPKDPNNPSKILAAELLRGVGGILIDKQGQRFCNEVGTRAYVADRMLCQGSNHYAKTRQWDKSIDPEIPTFFLVLTEESAAMAKKHVDLYSHKGLMQRVDGGLEGLAEHIGVPKRTLTSTWVGYQVAAEQGKDLFGKTRFPGVGSPPSSYGKKANTFWEKEQVFYVGTITPVLHYCMGGLTIDLDGNVLDMNNKTIEGLHAAGEVTGGVHGDNRLGGNSLLECTVFGTIVGKSVPIQPKQEVKPSTEGTISLNANSNQEEPSHVSLSDLQQHDSPDDCWVAVHGMVFDLTSFAEEHPAGPESIHDLCGQDGTGAFSAVHNEQILEDFEDDRVGPLEG